MMKILVVDDSHEMKIMLRGFLEHEGYVVLTATSVAQALKLLNSSTQPPDVVLSDVRMGTASGLELSKKLSIERPGLPVILFSVCEDVESEALRSGACQFLQRPFTLKKLAQVVHDVLEKKKNVKN